MTRKTTESSFDVRMKGFRDRSDVADLVALIDERIAPLDSEWTSIHCAAGRRLAEPVVAPVAVPGFVRSAMDGYAVRGEETFGAGPYNELSFHLVGLSLPGRSCDAVVGSGQAVRIMTGAPMPTGADAVVMAEHAREEGTVVHVNDPVAPRKNVGRIGEDIEAGDTLFAPPRTLRPQDVAVCAAVGVDRAPVIRRPTVAILVTGDELLPAGRKPHGCRIVDANSVLLRALIERDGALVAADAGQPAPILPDDRETIRAALRDCRADCILVSGGSSVGQEDHAPMLVAELGELAIHGLALRPASPAGMGFIRSRPVFLMPGNPVSCLCAYDLFAGRAIRRLGGRDAAFPYRRVTLPLARKISSVAGRVDYMRVRIVDSAVEPLAVSGASILSSTTRADGFTVVPKDSEGYPAGAEVDVYRYDNDSTGSS